MNFGRLTDDLNNYLKSVFAVVFFLISVVMSLYCAGGSISIRERVCHRNLNLTQFVTNRFYENNSIIKNRFYFFFLRPNIDYIKKKMLVTFHDDYLLPQSSEWFHPIAHVVDVKPTCEHFRSDLSEMNECIKLSVCW